MIDVLAPVLVLLVGYWWGKSNGIKAGHELAVEAFGESCDCDDGDGGDEDEVSPREPVRVEMPRGTQIQLALPLAAALTWREVKGRAN